MDAKLSPNLVSFPSVRRGDWILKISVFKKTEVLLVGKHYYDHEKFIIKHFPDHEMAAKFIDFLIEKT